MPAVFLDHFITYTQVPSIDEYIASYAQAGFLPAPNTVLHDPGLRNGFINIGLEYLGMYWVADEALFAAGDPQQHAFRANGRPYGIGLVADDVNAVYDDWRSRGYTLEAPVAKAPRDAPPDAPPAWFFLTIPDDLLPGAACFVVTYRSRSGPAKLPRKLAIAPNTTYAIAGVTFVSAAPAEHAAAWQTLLVPGAPWASPITERDQGYALEIGPHRATWITPEAYQARYKQAWIAASHACGELGVVHLLATNLQVARAFLEGAGRSIVPLEGEPQPTLFVAPDPRDGFAFTLSEQPVGQWMHDRIQRTGEQIEIQVTERSS